MRIVSGVAILLLTVAPLASQSGGQFEIVQSVISNGGATSGGGQFSVTGTIGQPVAGTTSNGSPYGHNSGFWQGFLAPTAAPVSVSGRILTARGRPVSRASVILDDGSGSPRITTIGSFGYFRFEGVEPGRTYILTATHRRYQFVPQLLNVSDSVFGVVLVALE